MARLRGLGHWLPIFVGVFGIFLGITCILPQAQLPWGNVVSTCKAVIVRTPHTSSFTSWWNPEGLVRPFRALSREWNLLYHLGGNGPWIEKIDRVVQGGIGVPDGCVVEQVHMVRTDPVPVRATNTVRRGFSRIIFDKYG